MNKRRSISNRAALNTSGHSVSQGGLRGHSIGPLYPYSVDPVYTTGWRFLGWTVRNLLTGCNVFQGDEVWEQPVSFRKANKFAKDCKMVRLCRQRIADSAINPTTHEIVEQDKRGFADRF